MKSEQPNCRIDGSVVAGGDETHRRMNTWSVRNLVCSNADKFVGNLLENSGAAVKRSRLEARNGIFDVGTDTAIPGPPWNHVETKRCHLLQRSGRLQRYLRLHRHNLTVTYPKRVDKECMRKRSESDPSGPKLAELLDALHVRLLVV